MMLTMVFPQMQEKFFTCIWHFKFAYEVLNWTMQSQTKACITNHHVRSALLRYLAALSNNSLTIFWETLSVPSCKSQEIQKYDLS